LTIKKTVSSLTSKKDLIFFDVGIATAENKAMVVAIGYNYVCVSRTKPSNYKTKYQKLFTPEVSR
jgi:isopentenyl diphosphate isomerase/L-lactate dehydrogenase-like FMN-dependent dehydrogenase